MNRKLQYLNNHTFYNLLIGLIISTILFVSCSTLQKQRGYENYQKNTNWKVRNYKI